ncbi:MAG: FmdB family zinc ribbon protein [Acidimicrobiales bacterium]
MPTYEYTCKTCGEHTEAVQTFSDDPLTVCPNCGGTLRKVFGNIGISFKGSGFYKNDSRKSGSAQKASSESSDGGSSSNGASKSDSGAGTGSGSGEKSASGDSSSSSSNGKTSGTPKTGSGDSPKSPAKR